MTEKLILESLNFPVLLQEKRGREWEIVVIEAGLSKNLRFYPAEILRESIELFEGVAVCAYEFDAQAFDHVPTEARNMAPGGFARNTIGWIENVRFDESKQALVARLILTESAKWAMDLLVDVHKADRNPLGFSIDAVGEARNEIMEGRQISRITKIDAVNELTMVTNPAAGGKTLRLVASISQEVGMDWKKILEALRKRPSLLEGFDVENVEEGKAADLLSQIFEAEMARASKKLETMEPAGAGFKEQAGTVVTLQKILRALSEGKVDEAAAMIQAWIESLMAKPAEAPASEPAQAPAAEATPAPQSSPKPAATEGVRDDELRRELSEERVDRALSESKLPAVAQNRIRKMFEGRIASRNEIREAVNEEKDYLATVSGDGNPVGSGTPRGGRSEVTEDQVDKYKKAMDGMLSGNDVDGVRAFSSIHESFRKITGFSGSKAAVGRRIMINMALSIPGEADLDNDDEISEIYKRHNDNLRESISGPGVPTALREALQTTTWAQVFGDSVRRILQKEHADAPFNVWQPLVSDMLPAQDFRTNRLIRVGQFADLSAVGQLGTYPELTEPADEEETAGVQKFGNLFSISWETVVNDDLGKIRQLPKMLGVSASRTLSKRILLTNLANNPTLADSNALISAAHNNNQTAALSQTTLQNAIVQMRKQTALSSGERLFVTPRYLVVPPDLEDLGWELINSRVKKVTNDDATTPNIFNQFYKLDLIVNPWQTDTNDWFLVADPQRHPTFAVFFLGGRREPEIFIQDQMNIGSVLTADKITYKIRHIHETVVQDHRSFAGSIVA